MKLSDLLVSDVSASGSAFIGEKIPVSWTVKNQVEETTTNNFWVDSIFISTDENLDENDISLKDWRRDNSIALESLGSYEVNTEIYIPTTTPGNYYLLFATDNDDEETEADETNNVYAHPLEVKFPDIAGNISANNGSINGNLNIEDAKLNDKYIDFYQIIDFKLGDFVTVNLTSYEFDTELFLFDRNTLQKIKIYDEFSGEIGSQLSFVAQDNIDYIVQVFSDEDEGIGNYTLSATSKKAPNINLKVTDAKASDVITLGDNIQISWTVENQGTETTTADRWNDVVYLSKDAIFDESDIDIPFEYTGDNIPLAGGESYTVTQSFSNNFLSNIGIGNRYLLFITDKDDKQFEINETDNVYAAAITLGLPDLIVSDATSPQQVAWGETVEISWTVENTSSFVAPANWFDSVYISDNEILDDKDKVVTDPLTGSNTPLAPGDSYTATRNIDINSSLGTGDRYLLFVTDNNDNQDETDETNNIIAKQISISAPDLVVENATAPESAILGENINVSWTVKNQGSVTALSDWYDYVYLSTDHVFDINDRQISYLWAGNNTPLASNTDYTASENITIPNDVNTGNYYLIFATDKGYYDSNGSQGEIDETNNTLAKQISIGAPDLVVSDASATSSNIARGQTVSVSWTVANQGISEAPTNWDDYIYLSDDQVFDNNDTFLNRYEAQENTPLAASASYTATQSVTIPTQTTTGDRYLLFVADGSKSQAETNENNNVYAAAITLGLPDLVVSTTTSPQQVTWGETVEISWTVENTSSFVALANWYDYVYISDDEILDNTDKVVTDQLTGSNIPLVPGDSYTATRNIDINSSLGSGDRYLLFVTDNDDNQGETDESNNVQAVAINISAPDLEITTATAPVSADLGETIELSWTVANQGDAAATADWYDSVYLSTDAQFDINDTYLTTPLAAENTPLAAGADYTATQNITIPNNIVTGSYYLLFVTDKYFNYYDNRQIETDETNNVKAVPIQVGALDVDLVVSDVSAPIEALAGQEIEIAWTVTNQGIEDATGTWTDYIYLSDDTNVGNDQFYGSFLFTGTIAGGESIERRQSITLPDNLSSDRYLIVRTDANNQLLEYGKEDNNTTVDNQAILVSAFHPNLQVTNVNAPETAFSSQETVIEWTVTNNGNGATSTPVWYDKVWLSLDQTFDETDTYLGRVTNASYLNVGESYNNSLTVKLPRGIDSNYYFLVKTDADNQVSEFQNEEDNFAVSNPTDVDLTPPPDLQVTSVNAPSQGFSGQTMSLSWVVTNQGTGRTLEESWYDEIIMSADEVIDENDYRLGRLNHTGVLNAGESYTATQDVTLPVGVSGNFYVFIRTDSGDGVFESVFESNNTAFDNTPTTINLTPPPDLEVESVDVPTTARAGDKLTINYRVTNFGATETPNYSWTDTFYLSVDDKFDVDSDVRLGSIGHSGNLDAGASYDNSASFTLDNQLTGDYYVFVATDSDNSVFELDNDNNTAFDATPVTIASQPADLIVSEVISPTSAEAGKAIRVNWTVKNQGTGNSIATSWYDQVVLSADTEIGNNDDIRLNWFTHEGLLDIGDSYNRSGLVEIPFNVVGNYNLFVVTDTNKNVYEATENNNFTAKPITITRQTPDLQVTEVTVNSATGLTADKLTVNWTVQNLGAGQTNSNFWYDKVYLSADENWDINDTYLGEFRRANTLAANEQYDASETFTVPFDAEGEFYVIVRTDAGENKVLEASLENNNDGVSADTITFITNPNPDPDLLSINVPPQFSPDLIVDSVDAPTQGVSGQSLEVSWTVNNQRYSTGKRSWYDVVYLSRDQIFDREDDIYLGSHFQSNLAAGDSYTVTKSFDIPRGLSGSYYIFVATDAGDKINEPDGESNNIAYDPNPIQITLPAPADLVAGTINIPANGVPGQNATIEYTVENRSSEPVIGNWYDSIYISADDKWDINDSLFAQVQVFESLESGESYSKTVNAALPGVLPGNYHVIIRSDIRNAVPELDESNNLGASLDQFALDAELLELGTPDTGTLGQGQAVYYRIEAEAGQTLKISLDSASDDGFNELYLRYGEMPTRGQFDFTTKAPFVNDPDIILPSTQAGTYYVLAYSNGVSGAPQYSISADIIPFSLESIGTDTVGNAGFVTLEITGAQFTNNTNFQLIDAEGNFIDYERVYLQDSSTVYATFDLEDQALGIYDVKATREDGETALLDNVLTVELGDGANVAVDIDGPDTVRPDRNYLFNINYANTGDSDTAAPLLLLQSDTSTPMGLELDGLSNDGVLQILGTSEGFLHTLQPGELAGVPVYYNSSTNPINFNVQAISNDNTEAIDWDLVSKSARPLDISEAQWDNIWGRIQPRIGNTWGDYVSLLNELSAKYSQTEEPIRDVRQLFSELLKDNPDFLPSSILSGQLLDAETGEAIAGTEIAAYRQVDGQYILGGIATTDDKGNFTISYLDADTYELALGNRKFDMDRDGNADITPTTYTITPDNDINDIQLYAETPSDEPSHINESDASLALTSDGTAHILWNREGQIWHASYDGSNWINAVKLTDKVGYNLSIKAAENLINGTDPGLIATWQEGSGNESEIYYAVGKSLENGGIEWSKPVALTNDSVTDSNATLIITDEGQALWSYLKTDYDIQDDTDVYYELAGVDEVDLTFASQTIGIQSLTEVNHSIAFTRNLGKVNLFGEEFEAKLSVKGDTILDASNREAKFNPSVDYQLSIDTDKFAVGSQGGGELKLTWKVDHEKCDWQFAGMQLDASAGVSFDWKNGLLEILNWASTPFPLIKGAVLFIGGLQTIGKVYGIDIDPGINVSSAINLKNLQWSQESQFVRLFLFATGNPELALLPDRMEAIELKGQFGPYLETDIGDGFKAKLSGAISSEVALYPTLKPIGINAVISYEITVHDVFTANDSWNFDVYKPQEANLLSLLSEEQDSFNFSYNPDAAIGTSNLYGENFINPNVYTDGSPSLIQASDGLVWMARTKGGEQIGNNVVVATFDGNQWSEDTLLPNALGLNSNTSITIDKNGQTLVVWAMGDASILSPESTFEEVLGANDTSDIVYALYQDGTWSEPIIVSAIAGNDKNTQVTTTENGDVILTWINDSDNESRLLTASWDGSSWTVPQEVTKVGYQEISNPTFGELSGNTTIFWTQDINSDPDIQQTSLFYSIYDGSWSAATSFAAEVSNLNNLELSTSENQSFGTASDEIYTQSGFFLPPVPEEWCEEHEDNPNDLGGGSNNPGGNGGNGSGSGGSGNGIGGGNGGGSDTYNPQRIRPSDPNDILGPDGFGDERWITATQPLDYTIRFENEPTATAPAQEVIITQQLDEDLDWRTFRIDDFGWGDLYFDLPGDRPFHNERIDLTKDYGFYADVFASIDITTGLATWRIITIDPETGEAPLDAFSGFLPINNEDGIGEGFVTYSIKAKRTAQTGDVIDAEARIIFDTEEPIDTPPIFNTLDATSPTSTVAALPAKITDEAGEFTVNWGGNDDNEGSGIASYTIYVSVNDGEFRPWLENTDLTEATYKGTPGRTYSFYAVATDNAGNTQEIPTQAQATTRIAGGTATIGDFVWVDTNGNGIQDTDEPGLEQVTVNIYDNGETLVSTTTTNINGFYSFTEIDPGDYFLEFIAPTSYLFTPENQGDDDITDSDVNQTTGKTLIFTVEEGEDYSNWDAGLYQLATISGQKFHDIDSDSIKDTNEPGLAGWTIYLDTNLNGELDDSENSTQTDANGNYSFNDLVPGTYTVAEVMQSGWQQTFPGNSSVLAQSITTTASDALIYTPSTPITTTDTALTTTASSLINLNAFRNDSRFTNIDGSGLTSVIIDTGIDLNHPFFGADNDANGIADRIVYQYDFANNDTNASDVNGHGSHVASIIASSDSTYTGIAPKADIIALKVFKDSGSGYFSDLEESLQWVIDNADTYNIASVNLSLGDEQNWNTRASHYGIGDELTALAGMGIIVTSAAGNNFAKFDSKQGLAYPATDPNVIAVGAVWENTDQIADFSQRHQTMSDIFAPGIPIEAANANGGVTTKGGTSQAAPYVAGIAVLAQQIAIQKLGRKLSVDEFRYLLETTSVTINDGDDEKDNVTNTGLDFSRVDILALAEEILNFNGEVSNPESVQPDTNSDNTSLYIPNNVSGLVHTVTVKSGETVTNLNFGNQKLNQTPELAVNKGLTLNEEDTAVITYQELQVTDADNTGSEITYILTDVPDNGILRLNGSQLAVDNTLTQDDIDNERLEYLHNGSETNSDRFSFRVTDGKNGNIDNTDFQITVNSVNDAPTLENAIANQTATEDATFTFTIPENTFNDVDAGDEITYAASLDLDSALPTWLNFNPSNRTFRGTPINSDVGTLNITVVATDKQGVTVSDTFTITVEEAVNTDFDGNQDGKPDIEQPNVLSLKPPTDNTEDILTFFSQPGSILKNAKITENPAIDDSDNPENKDIDFPVDFFNFELEGLTPGTATTVNLLLPQNQAYNTFWKYGKTPDNNQDHWYEFLYDGETGAQFIDTNDDGKADQIVLHFVDGKRGDADLTANGAIINSGAPGVTTTPLIISKNNENVWEIEGNAGAAVAKFSLVDKNSKQVNEVGVFKVDAHNRVNGIAPGAAGFAKVALQQSEVIFSALADDLLNDVDLTRKLQVGAGERLAFYFISDDTADSALSQNNFGNVFFSINQANPNSKDYLRVSETNGIYTLNWEQGNDNSYNDLVMNFQLENKPLTTQNLIGNYQGEKEGELINLESFTDREVKATFTLYSEAAYNNFVGFYKVDDAQGSITDELTGKTLKPGDAGYTELVVKQRIPGVELSVGNNQSITIEDTLEGGYLFAPFIIANGNAGNINANYSEIYTPYILGNSDKVDHIRLLGDNIFGFEDLRGGGDNDFNDIIIKANFQVM
jgi:Subtilase family/SdrD B-like domain/Cadherin-like/Putative Ig domain/CARDB/Domain of unknown function (DUF4114)/Bacterial pre-peptidase C-terminal domain